MVGYSPWGCKESDMTEQLLFHFPDLISSDKDCPILQADSLPAESQGKTKNTGGRSLSILQGIFLTQELNWGLLYCRQILDQLSYQGSSKDMKDHQSVSSIGIPRPVVQP